MVWVKWSLAGLNAGNYTVKIVLNSTEASQSINKTVNFAVKIELS